MSSQSQNPKSRAPGRLGVLPSRQGVLFDPGRRAGTAPLREAIGEFAIWLEGQELTLGLKQRKRKRTNMADFRLAVEALVCNFLFLRLAQEERPLAVPRGSDTMWSTGRYKPKVYGSHFLDALNVMEHPGVGVIQTVAKGYRYPDSQGTLTRIEATPRLYDHIAVSGITWDALGREMPTNVLVLKEPKPANGEAREVEYPETEDIAKLRREVVALNTWLAKAPLFLLPDAQGTHGLGDNGQPVDPTCRYVRRIFNNGSWYEGGRLYDGFWETMPRGERFERLRIGTPSNPDGEPIANVDYGQLFPRLAYMLARATPPEGDLYDIFGDGSSRAGVKKLFNALLFARKPLGHWPAETVSLFPKGMKLRDAIAAIERKHPAIAHLFGTGLGFKLMNIESRVLMRSLKALRYEGITALPLHDSVLVARSNAEHAMAILEEAIEELTPEGFHAVVTIDQGIEN